jgi:MarR family transcriptional regulator, transcriptional regulator for hemolysin
MTTPTAPDLGLLFNSAGHAVDSELTAKLAELGTTPRVICVLGKALGQELTQSRLGELAGLDKTTMVVTMDELERAGLAERRPSATDRRARIVAVTPAGEELLARGQKVVDDANNDILSGLPDADREVFVRCMTALVGDRLARPVEGARPARRRR